MLQGEKAHSRSKFKVKKQDHAIHIVYTDCIMRKSKAVPAQQKWGKPRVEV